MKTANRKLHLELLRIFSILCIIFAHTGYNGFVLFTQTPTSPLYPVFLLMAHLCRPSVVLFWMISGALLLEREESYTVLYRKRILRFALALVIFSSLQYAYYLFKSGDSFDMNYYLVLIFAGKISDLAPAYWYLYALLAILVMLPILRRLVKAMSDRDFIYLLVVVIFFRNIMHFAMYFSFKDYFLSNQFLMQLMPVQVLSLIAGYYFERRIPEESLNLKTCLLLLGGSFLLLLFNCYVTHYYITVLGVATEGTIQGFIDDSAQPVAFALFYALRLFFRDHKPGALISRLLVTAGSAIFGVMLLENVLRQELSFVFDALQPYLGTMCSTLVLVCCVWLCGTCITLVLKKIPGIKKIL